MQTKRTCIYAKDVQRITGKSERSGRRLLNRIREELGKEEHQFITIKEFSGYTGIDPATVREYLYD